jgi:hypothetical protein
MDLAASLGMAPKEVNEFASRPAPLYLEESDASRRSATASIDPRRRVDHHSSFLIIERVTLAFISTANVSL